MKNLMETLLKTLPTQTTVLFYSVVTHHSQAIMTFSRPNGRLETIAEMTFGLTDTATSDKVTVRLSVAVTTPDLPLSAPMPKNKLDYLALLRSFSPDELKFNYTGSLLHFLNIIDINYSDTMNIEPTNTDGKTATVIALQQALGDFDFDDMMYEHADLLVVDAARMIDDNSVADASQIRQNVYDAWLAECQEQDQD